MLFYIFIKDNLIIDKLYSSYSIINIKNFLKNLKINFVNFRNKNLLIIKVLM